MARTEPRRVEFEGEAPPALLEAYAAMLAAGAGWVNLLPEVVEPDEGLRRRLLDPAPPTAMGTAVARRSRRHRGPQLGVAHPQGRITLGDLERLGCGLPAGWRLVSSHARRGLVVDPDPSATPADQLAWLARATLCLCPLPTTGRLRAELHDPR